MEEGSRRTKDRRFIVGLRDRVANRILLLYVNIESKSSTFGMKGNLGGRRKDLFVVISILWSGG